MEKLISLKEAGSILGGISAKSVRRYVAEGLLPGFVKVRNRSTLPLSEVLGLLERLKEQRGENK